MPNDVTKIQIKIKDIEGIMWPMPVANVIAKSTRKKKVAENISVKNVERKRVLAE